MEDKHLVEVVSHHAKAFPANPILWIRGHIEELLGRDSVETAMREARAVIYHRYQCGESLNLAQVDDVMTKFLKKFLVDYIGWGLDTSDGRQVTVYSIGSTEERGPVPFFFTQVPRGLIAGGSLQESAISVMLRRRHGR